MHNNYGNKYGNICDVIFYWNTLEMMYYISPLMWKITIGNYISTGDKIEMKMSKFYDNLLGIKLVNNLWRLVKW